MFEKNLYARTKIGRMIEVFLIGIPFVIIVSPFLILFLASKLTCDFLEKIEDRLSSWLFRR